MVWNWAGIAMGIRPYVRLRDEVARPTLRVRGLLGRAEPILIAGGRAMAEYSEVFVGIDVAKVRNAVAIAEGKRSRLPRSPGS